MDKRSVDFGVLDQGELEALAAKLTALMLPGDTLVLSGEVGAGKTTFTRAACAALGVKERVTSPTYQLARSYAATVNGEETTVNHLDLYRLDGVGVADSLDLDEYLAPGSITFIEWAEPAAEIIERPSILRFAHASETTRAFSVAGPLAERLEDTNLEDTDC